MLGFKLFDHVNPAFLPIDLPVPAPPVPAIPTNPVPRQCSIAADAPGFRLRILQRPLAPTEDGPRRERERRAAFVWPQSEQKHQRCLEKWTETGAECHGIGCGGDFARADQLEARCKWSPAVPFPLRQLMMRQALCITWYLLPPLRSWSTELARVISLGADLCPGGP